MILAQVLSQEIDENGNIKVATEYTLTDGSKKVGHTRYDCFGFSKAKISEDIKAHCETLMRKTYNLKQNLELIKTTVNDLAYTCTSMEVTIKPAVLDKDGIEITPAEKITIDDSDPIKEIEP